MDQLRSQLHECVLCTRVTRELCSCTITKKSTNNRGAGVSGKTTNDGDEIRTNHHPKVISPPMLASAALTFQTPAPRCAASRRRRGGYARGQRGRRDAAWTPAGAPAADSTGGTAGAEGGTARCRTVRCVRT